MKIAVNTALVLTPLLLAACSGKESSAASESAKSASSKTSLDQFDTRLDAWRASAKDATGAEKDRLECVLRDLEPKRKELADKLAEVQRGGADAWAKLQPEIDRLLAETKKRFDAATQ